LPGSGPASVVIEYNLPADSRAVIELHNQTGDRVGIPAQGRIQRGIHMAEWPALGMPPGMYRCRLRANGFEQIQSFALSV